MKDQNQNQDIRKQIGMFFDRELDQSSEQEFLDRVNADPAFHRVFTKEKSIRDNLKKHVKRPGASPDLIQAIKNNIRVI
jgi:hypothetical protein